jgi:D-aspartate ligase
MVATPTEGTRTNLYVSNTPAAFWQLLIEPHVGEAEWASAVRAAASVLPPQSVLGGEDYGQLLSRILGEEIFGHNRWQLSRAKSLYYELKPFMPRQLVMFLRHRYRGQQEARFPLGWPIEDRYVHFQFNCFQHILRQRGLSEASYISIWPHNHRFAFTLTHDIETKQGFDFVQVVAALEERLGFRSSFNVVPERYPIDHGLLSSLRQRGFEIGVHGLKHDGKLFSSRRTFERRAESINRYLRDWGAVGFRSPYMHRNPEWLQALNVEYDLSFFDTDPYEPMPGGTMSIWPFTLGSFVELPYTLVQDHTLMTILSAQTPQLWLDKVDFIENWQGLALVNVHSDYLRTPKNLEIYEEFLRAMKEREHYWHALPRAVAEWWKLREQFRPQKRDGVWDLSGLPGATISQLSVQDGVPIDPTHPLVPLPQSEPVARIRAWASAPATQRVGAIVVGGCFQGLGIVRSLGRREVPVCIIDDESSISRFSRYATHAVRVANLRDERQTVDTVMEVGRRLGLEGWVLFPTREETVAAFSRYRSELSEWFRVPTPAWDTVQWAWDKRNTYSLAQKLGIPTPSTWYPESLAELQQIETEMPLAIKPAIKEHFIYATKAKAWRANSRAELAELYQRAADLVGEPGETMIQEFIPGDGQQQFAYCAFFKDGQAIGSMIAQRRRQHPPEFGRASTFVETVDIPLLATYSERFLKEIGYYGLVEMEYKRDPRDGQYKLLDFNARTWGYHTLGQRAGVDFPSMLYADQLGEPVGTCQAQVGIRWVRLVTDIPTNVIEILNGRQNLRAYLRSLRSAHIESVFSRDDPLPGLMELALVPYLAVKRGF